MLAEGLKSFNDLSLTIAGMILFMLVFVGIFIRHYGVKSLKAVHEESAMLPLMDEEYGNGK